jgi:hypothetical protein
VITCEQFMAELGDYMEGEVAADVRRKLESHLAHCRTCKVVCDSTEKTIRIVTDSGSFYLPDEAAGLVVTRIMERIRRDLES